MATEFKVGDEVFVGNVPARVQIAAISPCGNWAWIYAGGAYSCPHYTSAYPYFSAAMADLRPAPRQHPHAALMAEYAKDAAETDRPWERWEFERFEGKWSGLNQHPRWFREVKYRRKEQKS